MLFFYFESRRSWLWRRHRGCVVLSCVEIWYGMAGRCWGLVSSRLKHICWICCLIYYVASRDYYYNGGMGDLRVYARRFVAAFLCLFVFFVLPFLGISLSIYIYFRLTYVHLLPPAQILLYKVSRVSHRVSFSLSHTLSLLHLTSHLHPLPSLTTRCVCLYS